MGGRATPGRDRRAIVYDQASLRIRAVARKGTRQSPRWDGADRGIKRRPIRAVFEVDSRTTVSGIGAVGLCFTEGRAATRKAHPVFTVAGLRTGLACLCAPRDRLDADMSVSPVVSDGSRADLALGAVGRGFGGIAGLGDADVENSRGSVEIEGDRSAPRQQREKAGRLDRTK